MNKLINIFCLAVFMTTSLCFSEEKGKTVIQNKKFVPEWNALIQQTQNRKSFFIKMEKFKEKVGFPLDYWWRDNFENVVGETCWVGEGPCGTVVPIFVKDLRDSQSISNDKVVEVDESGKKLWEWSVPDMGRIEGVRNGTLIVSCSIGPIACDTENQVKSNYLVWLAIEKNGAFKILKPEKLNNESASSACESIDPAVLQRENMEACDVYQDLDTGKKRRLLFNGPCT